MTPDTERVASTVTALMTLVAWASFGVLLMLRLSGFYVTEWVWVLSPLWGVQLFMLSGVLLAIPFWTVSAVKKELRR